jgi:hypothetical protein
MIAFEIPGFEILGLVQMPAGPYILTVDLAFFDSISPLTPTAAAAPITSVPTLETRQMAPPKKGHPIECYLNQVACPESSPNICPQLDSRVAV